MASLAERRASPWTATSIRDRPAGCPTCASSLCGAVCGNGRWLAADVDGLLVPIDRRRRLADVDGLLVPIDRRRRLAGDDGPNAPRRDQHDTRRHPATSVSFWDGDR